MYSGARFGNIDPSPQRPLTDIHCALADWQDKCKQIRAAFVKKAGGGKIMLFGGNIDDPHTWCSQHLGDKSAVQAALNVAAANLPPAMGYVELEQFMWWCVLT